MKVYIILLFFFFGLLELSCKSRVQRPPRQPFSTETVSLEAMQKFQLGQSINRERVPKINPKEKGVNPLLKIVADDNKEVNQAFSPKTKGLELFADVKNDYEYFRNFFEETKKDGKALESHISTLKSTRYAYLDQYRLVSKHPQLAALKLFKPETSIKSDSFFDFFMGILDKDHKNPADDITFSEGYNKNNDMLKKITDVFKDLWKDWSIEKVSKYFSSMEGGVYPSSTTSLTLMDNNTAILKKETDKSRFLFLEKETINANAQWFEVGKELILKEAEDGVYIPYLGREEEEYKSLVVQNQADLSRWIKKAAKSIFEDHIGTGAEDGVSVTAAGKPNPVYYLSEKGKLVRLTKSVLQDF